MAFRFAFSKEALEGQEEIGEAINPNNIDESTLKQAGFNLSSNEMDDEYLFSRMGGFNVVFRSSIIRITFMKLLGTGVVAAVIAAAGTAGKSTTWSLGVCAAVNFIACYHYHFIWQTRLQTYRGTQYDKFMSKVGRVSSEDKALIEQEKKDDNQKIFWQEINVDGLRYSDWLVTLVLMTLDLGHLREYLYVATKGVVPKLTIAKEWLAALQSLMIFAATIFRFYCNEGRSTKGRDGKFYGPGIFTFIMAWGSFAASCALFAVIVNGLLAGIPDSATRLAASLPSHIEADIICLQVLTLVWIGYPAVALVARLGHLGLPGNYYNASWSTFKDIAFAFLDITSKAGLAIFFVLKSTWVPEEVENNLIAQGEAFLNITYY